MARPQGYRMNPWALKDMLDARLMAKVELSKESGLSLGAIRDLETGRRRASVPTIRKVSEALRCQPETLFPEFRRPVEVAA